MRLDQEDRKKKQELDKIYRPIGVNSNKKEIIEAQKQIRKIYEEKLSFDFLHLRYYKLKAYETTFSTQISFLFGTATTVAITVFSKEVFMLFGLPNTWSVVFSFLTSLATVFFFTFCGIYIGIYIGQLVSPVKRAYLFPYELTFVEKQLEEYHKISLPK